jgi:hypothetical protein
MAAVATREASNAGAFASSAEMHDVLEQLLVDLDRDPVVGPKLRSAQVPHRFFFPDFDLVLNVTGSEEDGEEHWLRWEFSDTIDWAPALSLEMESEVANRYLQGCENLAIAIARRRIRVTVPRARSALKFLPFSREVIDRYRAIVARDYPHLSIG